MTGFIAMFLLIQQGSWASTPPLPDPRQEVGVVATEGRIYVIGGLRVGGVATGRVDIFDTRSGTWQVAPPVPIPIHHPMVAAIGHKIYVAGGYTEPGFTAHAQTYEFDPDQSLWTRKRDMPTARGAGAAVSLEGRVYVFGGEQNGITVNDAASFDPVTNTWNTLPPMTVPRNHMGAALSRGRIYVIGGRPGNLGDNEAFEPATGRWSVKAPLPTPRSGIAVAAVGPHIYVFGGEGNPNSSVGIFNQNEVYDVDSDAWSPADPMPVPRHGIGAGVIGNRIYIPGGGPVEGYGITQQSDFFEVAQEVVLAQFVVGAGYRTEIVISNPASRAATIDISLNDANGGSLTTTIDGVSTSTVSLTLPALASRTISATDTSGVLRAGTVRIRANVRINSFAIVHAAGVSATTVYPVSPARSAMFHARLQRSESTNTGIAMTNSGAESTQVTMTLINNSGIELARAEHTIVAGGQIARYMDQLFAGLEQSDFSGTITVNSTRPVSVTALAFSRDGVVTIPVFPIE